MKYTTLIIAAVGLTNAVALPREPGNGAKNLATRSGPPAVRQPGFVAIKKRSDDPGPSRLPNPADIKGKGRAAEEEEDPVIKQLREQEEAYATDSSSGRSRGGTVTPPTSDAGTRSPSPEPMQPWQPDPDDGDPGSPTIPTFSNSQNRGEEEDPYGWNAHAGQVEQQQERENPFAEFPRYDVNQK